MSKPPAFQFYAADFLIGTADMEAAEVGAYIRLLCHQWDRGFVPKDKADRLAGTVVSAAVLAKFVETNGELRNERLEIERQKQAEYREERSRSGKAGARSRWNGSANGSAIAQPSISQWQNDGSSSSSSSSIKNTSSPKLRFTDDDRALAQEMFQLIREINPNAKQPNLDAWANEFRLMRERDGADRTVDGIRDLMRWTLDHSFWRGVVLSPAALRKQWDKLTVQRKEQHDPCSNSNRPSAAKWQGDSSDFAHLATDAPSAAAGSASGELERRVG